MEEYDILNLSEADRMLWSGRKLVTLVSGKSHGTRRLRHMTVWLDGDDVIRFIAENGSVMVIMVVNETDVIFNIRCLCLPDLRTGKMKMEWQMSLPEGDMIRDDVFERSLTWGDSFQGVITVFMAKLLRFIENDEIKSVSFDDIGRYFEDNRLPR